HAQRADRLDRHEDDSEHRAERDVMDGEHLRGGADAALEFPDAVIEKYPPHREPHEERRIGSELVHGALSVPVIGTGAWDRRSGVPRTSRESATPRVDRRTDRSAAR